MRTRISELVKCQIDAYIDCLSLAFETNRPPGVYVRDVENYLRIPSTTNVHEFRKYLLQYYKIFGTRSVFEDEHEFRLVHAVQKYINSFTDEVSNEFDWKQEGF